MIRFRLVAIALCVVLAALIGSAVLRGRALPDSAFNPLREAGLGVCDGKLCLFEIVPGITAWQDARKALAEHLITDDGEHLRGQIGTVEIRVDLDTTGSGIRRVEVQGTRFGRYSLSLRFSNIVELFGAPCSISDITPSNRGMVLAYPSFRAWVLVEGERLSVDSPVGALTLTDDADLSIGNNSCSDALRPGTVPWRGLASLEFYLVQRDRWRSRN
jgi:hypothetical protein